MDLIKKIIKLYLIISNNALRHGILHGIFATVEHNELLNNLNPQPKTLIDIGSNKGQFLIFADSIFNLKKIHSFEPIAEMIKIQKKAFRSIKYKFYNFALGNKNTKRKFFITNRMDSSSFLKFNQGKLSIKNYKIEEERTIAIKKIDKVFSKKKVSLPIIMKIDVQGFEMEVLLGAKNILKKCEYILTEVSNNEVYKNQKKKNVVIKYLKKIGYKIYRKTKRQPINGTSFFQEDLLFKKINKSK